MLRPLLAVTLTAVVAAPAAGQPQALPAEQLQKIKAATVFVKVSVGDEGGSGSGFVVQATKDYGLIVTNQHVVEPPAAPRPGRRPRPGFGGAAPGGKPVVEVVFNSGSPTTEWTVKGEVVYENKSDDIALLKVRAVKSIPEPLSLTGADRLPETSTVYVCGFPFGEALAAGDRNPEISIGTATVSSNRLDAGGEVVTVQLNGALNPGNSGGPVVSVDGKLVGVAVRTVTGAGIGFAVPPAMVRKAVDDIHFALPTVSWIDGEPKQVRLDYKAVNDGVRYDNLTAWVAGAPTTAPPLDVSKLAAAKSYPAVVSPDAAFAVVFPVPPGSHFWLQFAWRKADGKPGRSKPQRLSADGGRVGAEVAPRAGGREGPDPRASADSGEAFAEMRRYRDFQTKGGDLIGRRFQFSVLVTGVNDEDRPARRVMIADRFGRPVREVKLYATPEFGDRILKAMTADGRAKPAAKVTFMPVRFERYTTEAAVTDVTFFDDAYTRPGWSGQGEPADLGVRVEPRAEPVVADPPLARPDVDPRPDTPAPNVAVPNPPAPNPITPAEAVRPPVVPNAPAAPNVAAVVPTNEEGTSVGMIVLFVVGVLVVLGLVGWGVTGFRLPGGGPKASRGRARRTPVARRDDDDENDRPARRSRPRDDDEDDRPRSRRRDDDDLPRARRR